MTDDIRLRGYRRKKVLVTGGIGFIGLNLCLRLRELGANVTAVDYFVPPEIAEKKDVLLEDIHLAVADIRDGEKIERLVRGQEIIFNLAGKSGAADSNRTPLIDLDINCRGHLTFLEACRLANPGVTIVFPSSRLVYGKPRHLPVNEEHPVAPESIYAAHKLAIENYHLIYGRLHGMRTTVLRISNPYGPFQSGDQRIYGIANRIIQTAAANGTITLFGDGGQLRDYLFIDDLAEAFLLAAATPAAAGRIYNIGHQDQVSLRELAETAVRVAGAGDIVNVPWPADFEAIETGDYVTDPARAGRELNWIPRTGLEEGIAATIAACREPLAL